MMLTLAVNRFSLAVSFPTMRGHAKRSWVMRSTTCRFLVWGSSEGIKVVGS